MENAIRAAIEKVLGTLGVSGIDFVVEHPADSSHGDYATNVALSGSKSLGRNPRELAEEIQKHLEGSIEGVASVTIAGPGFINFTLSREFFSRSVADACAAGDSYGRNDSLRGEEVLFEYTSPNLFKPLHVGNLVGNIIGESISRLLEYGGATVRRINYPSDIGLTVAKGVWGLGKIQGDPSDIAAIGEAYRAGNEAYETDPSAKTEIEAVNRALYKGSDTALDELRRQGIETSHRHLTELCRKLGTTFDAEIRESEASGVGERTVREHVGDIFEESEGAIVFKGEAVGLHTRVFVNSQGLPTYEAKDLGNFLLKQEKYPSWTRSVIVTGNEQREYFKVLMHVMQLVFPDAKEKALEHIGTGFLTLTTGKMSSRKGNVLTGETVLSLLEEEATRRAAESRAQNVTELAESVAVGALKYQILRQGVGQDIVFDKERALSLEGDSGPYLMYTYARMVSVLEKAKEAGVEAATDMPPQDVYAPERFVYRFPEVVKSSASARAPHELVGYLTELASAFNAFYAVERIADPADSSARYKVAVTEGLHNIMKGGLHLLGIPAPKRM